MAWIKNRISPTLRHEWPIIVITLVAVVLRLYRLSAQPLWLDEIFSVQISRQGLAAILQNSLREPNPPFYPLLLRFTSGLWNVHSEFAWRWPSALWGILTIPAFYLLCRRFTGRVAASIASLTFAILPFHIYYSQEARVITFVTLLETWSSILIVDILAGKSTLRRWLLLASLSLVGIYSYYFYLLVVGVQGLVLLVYAHGRKWWLYATLVALSSLLSIYLVLHTIPSVINNNLSTPPLTLLAVLQSLAGEPVRFGVNWQQWVLLGTVGIFALLGIFISTRKWRTEPGGAYLSLLVLLPILIFASLNAIGEITVPLYETRLTLIFLPAFVALFALGMDMIYQRLGWAAPALIFMLVLVASSVGLRSYWRLTKGMESALAQSLRPQIQPGDQLVSLDYYTTAASYFYLADVPVLSYLRQVDGMPQFTHTLLLQPILQPREFPVANVTISDLRSSPRLWVLNRDGIHTQVETALTEGCSLVETVRMERYYATLWENCLP